jgi:hypothetical protein
MNSKTPCRYPRFLLLLILLLLFHGSYAFGSEPLGGDSKTSGHDSPLTSQEPCDTSLMWLQGGGYAYYFWKQPPNHPFLNEQFEMPPNRGGRLEAIDFSFYQNGSAGTPDADFYVWLTDGTFPLDDNPPSGAVAGFHIDHVDIGWYPQYTSIQAYHLGIEFDPDEKFHIGYSHAFEPGDTLSILSDDGIWGRQRSSGWNGSAWEDYWPYEFKIYAWICPFPEVHICGDCTGEGVVNAGDVVFLLSYLYRSGPAPEPLCVADVNCDGSVDAGDLVRMLNYLFGWEPLCTECCALEAQGEKPQTRTLPRTSPEALGDVKSAK